MDKKEKLPKAAILTWCYNNGSVNYGQILQCYAMQVIVQRLGYDVKVVKYRKKDPDEPPERMNKSEVLTGLYELWYRLKKVENKIDVRILKFIGFIKKNISLSRQCYTKAEVERECQNCDILFCGSDQIWNPATFDDVYALNFGTSLQKRIAYAPSGVLSEEDWSKPIYKKLGACIERLDLVTVREKESIEILQKYTQKDIVDVVDPTLLLSKEEWNQVASKQSLKEPFVFCYFLGRIRSYKLLLKEIMKKHGAQKVYFTTPGGYEQENQRNTGKYFDAIKNAGPSEFIALIRDAKAVCTDSFHGLALSIIYQKQFYIFERSMPNKNLWASSSRQRNLLEKFGIGGQRSVKSLKDLESVEQIDYQNIHMERDWERAKSMIESALRKG